MTTRFKGRRGTAALAASANEVLEAGEYGFETDTGVVKFGNGVDAWNDLPTLATLDDVETAVAAAMSVIGESVLGAPAASITFSSIPQTFRTLRLELIGASSVAATNTSLLLSVNGSAGTNYQDQAVQGNNGSAAGTANDSAASASVGLLAGSTAPANQPSIHIIEIPLYTGTTFRKVMSFLSGVSLDDTAAGQVARAGYAAWKSTAAITAVVLAPASGNFVAGTVARLYGIG